MGEKRKNPRSSPPPGHKSRKIVTKSDHHHTSKQQRSSNTDLPSDLWWDIFVLLPAKSLVRSRAVCKAWLSVIDDPFFERAHFNKQRHSSSNSTIRFCTSTGPPIYSVDLDALSELSNGRHTIPATPAADLSPHPAEFPVDTCHGLVFVGWEILNPLFGRDERLELPRFTLNPDNNVVRGLGYDYATDDYKAVVIDCGTHSIGEPQQGFPTYVYSLRSDSWRRIRDCPCGDDYWPGLEGPGVYLRGALHWMSRDCEIIALDLETERFRKLQLPPFWEGEDVMITVRHLDVLDGRLVVTDYCKDDYLVENFDAWVLKRGSWVKLFSLGCDALGLRPVAYMKNKRHILMQDRYNFYLVDAKRETMKRVTIRGLTGEFRKSISAQLFPESLFRPTRFCGVGGQQRMQRRISRESKKNKTRMMEKSKTELFFRVHDDRDLSPLF